MNVEISSNMIKKLSSGGDKVIGRVHNDLETDFIPHYLCISCANDIPKISEIEKDDAINLRIKVISYTKKYVDEPSNEFELKKDDNINKEMNSEEFKTAFNFIIFDAYSNYLKNKKLDIEPESVKAFKSEWVGDGGSNSTIIKFLESYNISNDVKHNTPSRDIEAWIKDENIGITIKKFSIELKKYCQINKLINVESKQKKICNKNIQVWIGIEQIKEDDENEDI